MTACEFGRLIENELKFGEINFAPVISVNTVSGFIPMSYKAFVEIFPVQCLGSPTVACSSHMTTEYPASEQILATVSPAGPAPTTVTSQFKHGPPFDKSIWS